METVWIVLTQLVLLHTVSVSIVNIALNKPASMSSYYGPEALRAGGAVDGNTISTWGNILQTATNQTFAWWKVDLQREVQDAAVRIYFRTDFTWRRNGVKLYTSTSPFSSYPEGHLCRTVTGDPSGSDIPDVYNVTCPGRWRYFLLYTNTNNGEYGTVLDVGEVEVLVCSEGTYGEYCTNNCSSRNCVTMDAICERGGRCPDGCQSGWTGVNCTRALPPCINNNYGQNCDKLCSDRKCKAPSTSSCDRSTGRCPGGCEDGWRDEDCTQECDSGFYGASCTFMCPNRQCLSDSSTCDHVTGQCDGGCQSGYKALDCIYPCDSGFYGPGCSSVCSERKCVGPSTECNHVTGQCRYGCKLGFKGIDCVDECESGTYGNCSLSCSDRNCLNRSADCNHVTGQCEGGCQPGYHGIDCRRACDVGINYGVSCTKSCTDRHCNQPSSECDTRTGECIDGCQVGWTGVDCTSQCPADTFGSNCTSCSTRHCQGESDCPADGTCSQGCQDGWIGNTCLQECSPGMYGPGCSMACGKCSSDEVCHHVTGNCPSGCKAGWRTEKCTVVCSEATYGSDCTEKCGKCDSVCDSVDGSCPAGCLDGYNGTKCDLALQADASVKEPVYFGVVSLAGAVVGTFTAVVLLAVGVHLCLIRQGRIKWIKTSEDKKHVQQSRDFTQMSSISPRPAETSEFAQSSNQLQVYNNDYAVLDAGTKTDNKDYDVIKPHYYQNV